MLGMGILYIASPEKMRSAVFQFQSNAAQRIPNNLDPRVASRSARVRNPLVLKYFPSFCRVGQHPSLTGSSVPRLLQGGTMSAFRGSPVTADGPSQEFSPIPQQLRLLYQRNRWAGPVAHDCTLIRRRCSTRCDVLQTTPRLSTSISTPSHVRVCRSGEIHFNYGPSQMHVGMLGCVLGKNTSVLGV